MRFLSVFSRGAPNSVFLAILLGILAGASYSALIPLVLEAIAPPDPAFPEAVANVETFLGFKVSNHGLAAIYLLVCSVVMFARSASEIMLLRVGSDVAKKIRTRIYNRISEAPLSAIEGIGPPKLIASINIDVPRIIMGARLMPTIFINLVTLVGMLGFLLYLNTDIFRVVVISIAMGIVLYQLPMAAGRKFFERNREINDASQESISGLINGTKELKLDKDKRANFFERVLLRYEDELVHTEKTAYTITRATASIGDLLSFFVIGSITFIFTNYFAIDKQELVGIVMALLYITTPLSVVLNSIPGLTVAAVSYRKVERLLAEIPKEEIADVVVDVPDWQCIKFNKVAYRYPSRSGEKGFGVGPVDVVIKRGEITFITGGNGSGKSTFSKLITQHYFPTEGVISFDDIPVVPELVASYRQKIGAIYSNYYLFNQLLLDVRPEIEALANRYLAELRLDKKVRIENGRFSTTSLSDGQRKRLALLVAFLEDKELYLFDEWAADQDPEFKDIFYTEILAQLKRCGKAVVVISHDDRYFHVADKLLRFESGRLIQDQAAREDESDMAARTSFSKRLSWNYPFLEH